MIACVHICLKENVIFMIIANIHIEKTFPHENRHTHTHKNIIFLWTISLRFIKVLKFLNPNPHTFHLNYLPDYNIIDIIGIIVNDGISMIVATKLVSMISPTT